MTTARTSWVSPLIPALASRHTGARPRKPAQIYGRQTQKLPEPLTSNVCRRRTCKTGDDTEHTNPSNASCPVRSKAVATFKSP